MIGALSLVIVVWLGTSMNCSRRSTLTGRSTIGIRKTEAGALDEPLVGPAEAEDDHPLVLLHDPHREVQDRQDDDEDDDQADDRVEEVHGPAPSRSRAPAYPGAPAPRTRSGRRCSTGRLDDEDEPVLAGRRGPQRRAGSSGRPRCGPSTPRRRRGPSRAGRSAWATLPVCPDDLQRADEDRALRGVARPARRRADEDADGRGGEHDGGDHRQRDRSRRAPSGLPGSV